MYKWFACFKSGIKATDGDFRRNQPAVELCSIKNCEILDDSAENIENRLREMYHHILILVTKTYNKRIDKNIKCVDIVGVYAKKV